MGKELEMFDIVMFSLVVVIFIIPFAVAYFILKKLLIILLHDARNDPIKVRDDGTICPSGMDIHVVTTASECNNVVKQINRRLGKGDHRAVGFDCEWVHGRGFRNRVALLQLATADGYCGLFRLCQMEYIPQSLKDLLEDKYIYKVGVGSFDDAMFLYQDYEVDVDSTRDLSVIAEKAGRGPGGLAPLAWRVLGINLIKGPISWSDWERYDLTEEQVYYAAADAYAAIKIHQKLVDEDYRCRRVYIHTTYPSMKYCHNWLYANGANAGRKPSQIMKEK